MSERPLDAEMLDPFQFYVTEKSPSKFAPGATALVTKVLCPACREPHHFKTGVSFACDCGLSMEMGIGTLYVWRKETVSA